MKYLSLLALLLSTFSRADISSSIIQSITNPVACSQSGAWTVSSSGTSTVTQGTSPWVSSCTQSGTWTFGRTWTLSSSTDSVSTVDNITQFGGTNLSTGTGNGGAGIPRVTVSNDSSITNISGTISLPTGAATSANQTTEITNLGTIATNTSNTNTSVQNTQGTVNAGTAATKSDLVGGQYNTTVPALTNTQQAAIQLDSRGAVHVTPLDGSRQSYSTAVIGLVPAASATDVFTITGSGTKTIRVMRIDLSYTQSAANVRDFILIKRSGPDTGGTSTQPTIVPHDSTNAGATAIINAFTANPTPGTAVGTMRAAKLFAATGTGGSSSLLNTLIWDFGNRPTQAVVLRGTAQVLAVNLDATTLTSGSLDISIEWSEE